MGKKVTIYTLAEELDLTPSAVSRAFNPNTRLDPEKRRKILEAADKGTAVLLVSTEMEEILSLSDTIRIISDGRLSDPLKAEDMNPERLGLLLGGSAAEEKGGREHE